jgi:isocitrate/isopropylmalate dehydrogenase
VRENIEDTYGGIEHMQTNDVAQCRRLITRPGCEQVHRYAFEMANNKGAKRVTCAHKANIMKVTVFVPDFNLNFRSPMECFWKHSTKSQRNTQT